MNVEIIRDGDEIEMWVSDPDELAEMMDEDTVHWKLSREQAVALRDSLTNALDAEG